LQSGDGKDEEQGMSAVILSLATFFSTLIGGLFGLRYRDHLNLLLGFTAGVLVGLVSFDLLPEIFRLVYSLHLDSTGPMIALMGGFLLFHIV
jgi:ZIP family zinc transporter